VVQGRISRMKKEGRKGRAVPILWGRGGVVKSKKESTVGTNTLRPARDNAGGECNQGQGVERGRREKSPR